MKNYCQPLNKKGEGVRTLIFPADAELLKHAKCYAHTLSTVELYKKKPIIYYHGKRN